MIHPRRNHPMMSRTHRACWLFLAFVRTSSGFSPQPCTFVHSSSQSRTLSYSPPLLLVTDEDEGTSKNRKKGPFFRRAVRRIFKQKRTEDDAASMCMLTREASLESSELSGDFVKGLRLGDHVNTDFILKNFQTTRPNDIFPLDDQRRNALASEDMYSIAESITLPPDTTDDNGTNKEQQRPPWLPLGTLRTKDVQEKVQAKPTEKIKIASPYEGGTLVHRMTRSWFQNLLTGIIQRRSKVPPLGLNVRVAPLAVVKKLCRGQFSANVAIDFHRVVFQNIRLTGGSLEAKHMTLGLYGGGPRYASQFHIHANNCTFTQDDLLESSCIRNGLARLLVRILSNAGVKTLKIQVTAVDIVVRSVCACVFNLMLYIENLLTLHRFLSF